MWMLFSNVQFKTSQNAHIQWQIWFWKHLQKSMFFLTWISNKREWWWGAGGTASKPGSAEDWDLATANLPRSGVRWWSPPTSESEGAGFGGGEKKRCSPYLSLPSPHFNFTRVYQKSETHWDFIFVSNKKPEHSEAITPRGTHNQSQVFRPRHGGPWWRNEEAAQMFRPQKSRPAKTWRSPADSQNCGSRPTPPGERPSAGSRGQTRSGCGLGRAGAHAQSSPTHSREHQKIAVVGKNAIGQQKLGAAAQKRIENTEK